MPIGRKKTGIPKAEAAVHFYELGLKNNLGGHYDEAIVDYTRAIEVDPRYIEAYLKRGSLLYKILKNYRKALDDFNTVLGLDDRCGEAFLKRGIVKCHLLLFEEALPDLDRAVELDPNNELAFFNRGKNKYMLKKDEACVRADLERAILLGAPQAADVLKLFYGKDKESFRGNIAAAVKDKAKILKKDLT